MAAFYAESGERELTLAAIRERGLVTNHEVQLKRADGTVITGLANSHVLRNRDGSFLGVEGIIRNISDRKRTENALAQATKKLNLLTAITLNDIRNALFTLSGYLELEIRQLTEEKRAEFHQKEKVLLHQIDLQLTMARNYQSLGISPPRWHAVSTTFILAISHLGPSDIGRILSVDNLEIYADPLLEIVFQNLAENVLHHAPSATAITLRYEKTKEGLSLIFEDNGPGIPDDKKEAVFERGVVTRNGSGLFMVREILEITGISISETGDTGRGPGSGWTFPGTGTGFQMPARRPDTGLPENPVHGRMADALAHDRMMAPMILLITCQDCRICRCPWPLFPFEKREIRHGERTAADQNTRCSPPSMETGGCPLACPARK